jgi:hypothetical protein
MLCLDNNVVYLLLPCFAWTTMLYIYCCHTWPGQQCCIFIVAMLGLDIIVVYLLLPCLVWTTMWYIYCCHAWFEQQCDIFTVARQQLIYHIVVQTRHGNSKYTTMMSKPSMATINIQHCCPSQA